MNIIIIVLIVLTSQQLYLLNEEFLILVSFTIFYLLVKNQLQDSISNYFNLEQNKYKQDLSVSLKNLSVSLKNLIIYQKKLKLTSFYFNFLKKYYSQFNFKTINKLINVQQNKKNEIFLTKLKYLQELETQFIKLIIILILEKINKIVILNNFYSKQLKINEFNCFSKITLKEYLNSL